MKSLALLCVLAGAVLGTTWYLTRIRRWERDYEWVALPAQRSAWANKKKSS